MEEKEMKNVGKVLLWLAAIIFGVIMIPAMIALCLGIGGTIIGFICNPAVMVWIIIILGIVSIPGIIIGMILGHH